MLRLVSPDNPVVEQDSGTATEPGIYADRGPNGTTLYTFIGQGGDVVGYAMLPAFATHGGVSPELQALYDRCVSFVPYPRRIMG